jgi:putative hydrolase of the HAD superfamily
MNKAGITDIFFDLDHTLWDFDKNSMLAFQRVFLKHAIPLDVPDFVRAYEPINFDYWKLFRDELVTKEELRRGRLIDAFRRFDLDLPLQTIDLLAESYIDELPLDNHLFEGALEILEYLFEKYSLHIITNGFQQVQYLKLKNSGIESYFKTITTSEEVGLKKPNPVIFETALTKASVKPKNSIMIGDSFEADILGAENAEMHTLFFNYRNEIVAEKYAAINELLEIKNHL